jgi:hypothetical protein
MRLVGGACISRAEMNPREETGRKRSGYWEKRQQSLLDSLVWFLVEFCFVSRPDFGFYGGYYVVGIWVERRLWLLRRGERGLGCDGVLVVY